MAKDHVSGADAPHSPLEKQKGSFSYTRAWMLCDSIRSRAKSLIEYFQKTQIPEPPIIRKEPVFSGIWDFPEHLSPLENENKREKSVNSGISKTVAITSFCVAGILSWLSLAQMSSTAGRITSDTLHAFWVSGPTVYDKEQSLILSEAKLQASLTKAKSTIQGQSAIIKTQEIAIKSAEDIEKNRIASLREIAEKKQKIIDAKLKEYLVLQGMKGALKHEWIPYWVHDYEKYIVAQERSIRIISEKIAMRSAKNPSAIVSLQAGKSISDKGLSWIRAKGNAVSSMIITTPDGGTYTVPLRETLGNTNPIEVAKPTSPIPAEKSASPQTAISQKDATPLRQSFIPENSTASLAIENKSKIETAPTIEKPPIAPDLPGLTPKNITRKKIAAFIDQTNEILGLFKEDHPLRDAKITMKPVKVKGVAGWRVFLKMGDRTGYFTLKPRLASRNYKIVASQADMLRWAEKKAMKWQKA